MTIGSTDTFHALVKTTDLLPVRCRFRVLRLESGKEVWLNGKGGLQQVKRCVHCDTVINKGSVAHRMSALNGKTVPHNTICQARIDNEHPTKNRKRKRKDNHKRRQRKDSRPNHLYRRGPTGIGRKYQYQ